MKFECSLVVDWKTHTAYVNVCAGGNTELTGFKARLHRDLCDLLPEYSKVLDVWMQLAPNSCNVAVGSLYLTVPTGKASCTSFTTVRVSVRAVLQYVQDTYIGWTHRSFITVAVFTKTVISCTHEVY
jgi:actin-related protein